MQRIANAADPIETVEMPALVVATILCIGNAANARSGRIGAPISVRSRAIVITCFAGNPTKASRLKYVIVKLAKESSRLISFPTKRVVQRISDAILLISMKFQVVLGEGENLVQGENTVCSIVKFSFIFFYFSATVEADLLKTIENCTNGSEANSSAANCNELRDFVKNSKTVPPFPDINDNVPATEASTTIAPVTPPGPNPSHLSFTEFPPRVTETTSNEGTELKGEKGGEEREVE